MKFIDKIVVSSAQPKTKDVLWIDTNYQCPQIKAFNNGCWCMATVSSMVVKDVDEMVKLANCGIYGGYFVKNVTTSDKEDYLQVYRTFINKSEAKKTTYSFYCSGKTYTKVVEAPIEIINKISYETRMSEKYEIYIEFEGIASHESDKYYDNNNIYIPDINFWGINFVLIENEFDVSGEVARRQISKDQLTSISNIYFLDDEINLVYNDGTNESIFYAEEAVEEPIEELPEEVVEEVAEEPEESWEIQEESLDEG